MFNRSTLAKICLFLVFTVAAMGPWTEAFASMPFSNRTVKVLKRLGIEDLETLKRVYADGGRRKFMNVPGLGGKGLKEIESQMSNLWETDPELTPLAELGLSERTISSLEAIEPIKNLRDLKALYEKYGRRLTTFDNFGESNLREVRELLKIENSGELKVSDDSQNIAEVGLSNRVTNALWHKGLRTLGDLKQKYEELGERMVDIPGIGHKGLKEIEEFFGVPPRIDTEPKISPRTKGKMNQLGIKRVEELKDKSQFWLEQNFREKGVSELLRVLKEQYGVIPFKNELERAIRLHAWETPLDAESMNIDVKRLKFLGFATVGDLYRGYKSGTPEFRRYQRDYDLDIRTKIDAAEHPCEEKL